MGKDLLRDLLFPPRCAFCGQLMDAQGDGICPGCRPDLPYREGDARLRFIGGEGFPCAAALYYDGPVPEGVHALKFNGKPWRAEVFGRFVARAASEVLEGPFDAVTYVPVSPLRNFRRGYDQARLIARAAGKILGLRAEPTLRKIRHNRAQSSLTDPSERARNVRDVYTVPHPERVKGRRFLLVDDVCTTGSTMAACARTLMEAGAASVSCAALAGEHRRKGPKNGADAPENSAKIKK